MAYDVTRALSYLIDQHKHCQEMMDKHSTPGFGRPMFAKAYADRLASLDRAIAAFSGRAALEGRE